jgi:hypothetical protein
MKRGSVLGELSHDHFEASGGAALPSHSPAACCRGGRVVATNGAMAVDGEMRKITHRSILWNVEPLPSVLIIKVLIPICKFAFRWEGLWPRFDGVTTSGIREIYMFRPWE